MESEQYTNARKRFAGQFLVKKLREDQDWRTEVSKVIHERLGISPEIQEECFSVDKMQTVYSERAVPSQGLAGIMSNYRIRCVSVHVLKPDHAELLSIGLPRGNDFISKEYNSSSDQLDLHVWTWAPVPIEEEDSTNKFHGTALEELSRDLIDVKEILGQTAEDPQFLDMGLGKPFKTALQKINTCVEKLSDIDKTVKNVDVSGIMYNREMEHRGREHPKLCLALRSLSRPTSWRQHSLKQISFQRSASQGITVGYLLAMQVCLCADSIHSALSRCFPILAGLCEP
jgi:hypothetical protein